MGGNNNGSSGNDPRGRVQNEIDYQKQRYEGQRDPATNQMAYNYGRGSELNFGTYNDVMRGLSGIAGGGGGGGGGGFHGISASTIHAPTASYEDPFNSYSGFQDFSKTGGYAAADIANMRARGISPIRAAYSNAEREIGRQRSLQGDYSPNAIAVQARMAREQGQATSDAAQGVESELAQMRNEGQRFGLTGMSGIEGQRLGADVDLAKFNTTNQFAAAQQNAAARQQAAAFNASGRAAASAQSAAQRGAALDDMRLMYGTTPGMANTFGNQLNDAIGQSGNFGLGIIDRQTDAQKLPGAYETWTGRARDIAGAARPIIEKISSKKKSSSGSSGGWSGSGADYGEDVW